jgi:hypothetical protein
VRFSGRVDVQKGGTAAGGTADEYALAVGEEVDGVETGPSLDSEVMGLAAGQGYEMNDGIARVDEAEPVAVGSGWKSTRPEILPG